MTDWIAVEAANLAAGTEVLARIDDDTVVQARYTGVAGEEFVDLVQGWPIMMVSSFKICAGEFLHGPGG